MSDRLRGAVVPAYLLLCILLGGSAQGVWSNMVLQLLAIAIIGWSVVFRASGRVPSPARSLALLAGLAVLLVLVQLIPLPPALWTALPGRDTVVRGFELLGQPLGWMPISLAPFATMETALTLLPPFAVLAGMLLAGAYKSSWVAAAVLLGTFLAVLLGALQVGSGAPEQSPWYFYPRSNFGYAVGFFANSNHMAALLVVSVPLLFAIVRGLREQSRDARSGSAAFILGVAGAAVLLTGIVLNGSLAGLLLGPPVLALSATMLVSRRGRLRRRLAMLSIALMVVAAGVAKFVPLPEPSDSSSVSLQSRDEMWLTTLPAIAHSMPVGTGIGTFVGVYHRYENPNTITQEIVVHAHNDYLELALETGVAGVLLILAFLAWWGRRTIGIWRSQTTDRYARAATIASGALLVHSLVDFPLRTAALSAVFAACLAIMAQPRIRKSTEAADLWPTRHMAV
jgi:O-antigen ligase